MPKKNGFCGSLMILQRLRAMSQSQTKNPERCDIKGNSMEKDKKQIEGNLLGRSILYILLMTCALGLVAYLVQYGFFYLNIISFQRGDDSSPIIATLLPFII